MTNGDMRKMSAQIKSQGGRRGSAWGAIAERDPTDYEHRHFVNLLATAFLLALALCIGVTIKMFDEQQKLEKCLLSGRKDCVPVTQGAPRGMIVINRHANR